MSFLSVLLGSLIGGILSEGALIGLAFAGKLVAWWLALLLGALGCMIGGFVAGLIARGAGAGAIAGFLTGLIVLLGTFLIVWLVLKGQILNWYDEVSMDINTVITPLLDYLGIDPSSTMGQNIADKIETAFTQYSSDIGKLINNYFVVFALIIGAIFGGICAVVNIFTGLIGGLITRKKAEEYYY